MWQVRHSALFALPAILSRLPPSQRRALALETIITLSKDNSATVRSGVLEALGEVLYTFHEDEDGPPVQLLQLFLGREDKRVRDSSQPRADQSQDLENNSRETLLESFYNDPSRPLVCAFNYPAVALTLGRNRWPELREAYLHIASDKSFRVRRTLAASLGELAKIIGAENAQRDLVGIWWDSIHSEEGDVRVKAVECVSDFVLMLGSDAGADIIRGLHAIWEGGGFKSWRERHDIAKALMSFASSPGGQSASSSVRGLLRKALEDSVAAVREAAITSVSSVT